MLGSRSLPRLGFYLSPYRTFMFLLAAPMHIRTTVITAATAYHQSAVTCTKDSRYWLHIKPRERSLGEKLKLRSCCIDWTIDQDWGLRFSRKDWVLEVNELSIIWLFLAKMIHAEVITSLKSFPSIKSFLWLRLHHVCIKKVKQTLWFQLERSLQNRFKEFNGKKLWKSYLSQTVTWRKRSRWNEVVKFSHH